MTLAPFHLAIVVADLKVARRFYGELLECEEGRSADSWVDFNFFGHQLVCHLVPEQVTPKNSTNWVDHDKVPVPHFGVVMDWGAWQVLADKLGQKNIEFVVKPGIRFTGRPGEQATFFITDPFGNVLEFKSLRRSDNLFNPNV